jgi:crotonobetainyl-CoA:carnitine CoA-transferase CaiB-like acyl-CoA transferase
VTSVAPDLAGDGLLDGYTVIDFTRVLAGPYCTRLLADLGARVIKIERPGEGDEIRYTAFQLDANRCDQSSYYARLNTGKEGIAIDLSLAPARDIVLDLVRSADVVVENFSPGVMARYGLDAATLRAEFPGLVYCSISGFGQTGPLSSMQAYAHLINAISGMMDLDRGGEGRPRVSYLQAADVLAGTHAFGAICAALLRSVKKGMGATLDISMLECLIAADDITYGALLNGAPVERQPRIGMMVHAFGERHIALQTAGAPHLWARLVSLIGKPELAGDPRFSTPQARRDNWSALQQVYRGWLSGYQTADDAIAALSAARVPVVPMLSPEEVIEHPQLKSREAFPEVAHAGRGRIRVTATPFFVDGKPTHPRGSAPYRIGEHTHQVLSGMLGYAGDRIDTLRRLGVIEMPDTAA